MSDESAVAVAPTTGLPTGTWNVDPVHSSVEFQVKHLGIATVKGHFNEFQGTLEVGQGGAKAHGTVKVASVDTGEPQRDEHLRSPDFFDAATYPEIDFRSTAIRPAGDDDYEIDGELQIHGVKRAITLKATVEGTETDPQGNDRVGLSVSGQINRSDHEMKFNAALGSGNMVVSDKVKIQLEISAIKGA